MRSMSRLILIFALASMTFAGCKGKSDCEKACDKLMELAQGMMKMLPEQVRAEGEKKMKEEFGKCPAKCEAGKLDPKCVIAAKSLEDIGKCEKNEDAADKSGDDKSGDGK